MRTTVAFNVTLEDGRKFEDRIGITDFIAAERHFGKSLAQYTNVRDVPLEAMVFASWNSLRRHRKLNGEAYQDWLDCLEEVEFGGEAPAPEEGASPE